MMIDFVFCYHYRLYCYHHCHDCSLCLHHRLCHPHYHCSLSSFTVIVHCNRSSALFIITSIVHCHCSSSSFIIIVHCNHSLLLFIVIIHHHCSSSLVIIIVHRNHSSSSFIIIVHHHCSSSLSLFIIIVHCHCSSSLFIVIVHHHYSSASHLHCSSPLSSSSSSSSFINHCSLSSSFILVITIIVIFIKITLIKLKCYLSFQLFLGETKKHESKVVIAGMDNSIRCECNQPTDVSKHPHQAFEEKLIIREFFITVKLFQIFAIFWFKGDTQWKCAPIPCSSSCSLLFDMLEEKK